eukprot:tig00021348_g20611.t1
MEQGVFVICASSGRTFRVPAPSVEALRQQLSALCGIPPADQILLTGAGVKVEASKSIAVYTKDPVYVYDRRSLASEAPAPVEPLPAPTVQAAERVAAPLTLGELEEAARAGSAEARALLEAEAAWRARAERADELRAEAEAAGAACEVALQAMRGRSRRWRGGGEPPHPHAAERPERRRVHAGLRTPRRCAPPARPPPAAPRAWRGRGLGQRSRGGWRRAGGGAAGPGGVEVHAALRAPGRRTLLDFAGGDRLRALARDCGALLAALRPRAAALDEAAAGVRAAAEAEAQRPWPVRFGELEAALASLRGAAEGLAAARAAALRQHRRACAAAAALLAGAPEADAGAEAAADADAERAFVAAEAAAAEAAARAPPAFAGRGSARAAREIGNRTAVASATLEKHAVAQGAAGELGALRRLAGLVGSVAEGLGRLREEELLRRERFHQEHGRLLPAALLGRRCSSGRPWRTSPSPPSPPPSPASTRSPAPRAAGRRGRPARADEAELGPADLRALLGPCPRCSAGPAPPRRPRRPRLLRRLRPDAPDAYGAASAPAPPPPPPPPLLLRVLLLRRALAPRLPSPSEIRPSEPPGSPRPSPPPPAIPPAAAPQPPQAAPASDADADAGAAAAAAAEAARAAAAAAEAANAELQRTHEALKRKVTPAYANLYEACRSYREACGEVARALGAQHALLRGEGVDEVDTGALVEAARSVAHAAAMAGPATGTSPPRPRPERSRAALRNFGAEDVAVFVHQPGSPQYMAAHVGAPNFFLADECRQALRPDERMPFLVARIVEVQARRAAPGPGGNPFGLTIGTPYYVVTAGHPDLPSAA